MTKRLADKFDPIDVIAMMIIVGCMVSMALQNNSVFKDVLQTIVGFYFGRQTTKEPRPPAPPSNNTSSSNIGMLLLIILLNASSKY